MKATRNTIFALGLALLTFAAVNSSALAQVYGPGCNASCEAGCGGACCNSGDGSCQGSFAQGFVHDPSCRYADNPGCFEADPLLGRFGPEFCDLSRRCAACTWRFDASALYLHRAEPSPVQLVTDPNSGASLLSGNDLEMPFRVGPRLAFVVTDCAGLGLELNYFAVDGWSATRDFANTDFPSGIGDIVVDSVIVEPVTDAHISISSMLHSSEINLRQNWFGGVDLLTGFRWIDMFDRYDASGTSGVTGNQVQESLVTRNHLFGWQCGLDSRLGPDDCSWAIRAFIKGGGMLNNATTNASLSDPGNLGSLAANDTVCHIAGFGEAGLSGQFQIDKHVSVTFGYQVMYINNVAQPVNQIAQTDLTAGTMLVNVGNSIFYHGANLGIDLCW